MQLAFPWSATADEALKKSQYLILHHVHILSPDFIVEADASVMGLGGILSSSQPQTTNDLMTTDYKPLCLFVTSVICREALKHWLL